jgi:outer membrane phospholipase A
MDVVIHFMGKRYVVELKIWRGAKYNSDGEKQIMEYLNYFDLMVGYMLSFSFNKNKTPGVSEIRIGDKLLYEGIV